MRPEQSGCPAIPRIHTSFGNTNMVIRPPYMVQRTHEYSNTVANAWLTHIERKHEYGNKITVPGAEKFLPLIVFVRKAMREKMKYSHECTWCIRSIWITNMAIKQPYLVQTTHEYGNQITNMLLTHQPETQIWYSNHHTWCREHTNMIIQSRMRYTHINPKHEYGNKITVPGAEKFLPLIVFVRKAMRDKIWSMHMNAHGASDRSGSRIWQ